MQGPKPTRFVILHHVQKDGEHWDLMLEEGEVLLTWQLPADPARAGVFPMAARRIADHRLVYLTYEGEISGGRGSVTRVEQGAWKRIKTGQSAWDIRLLGEFLKGDYRLESKSDDLWTYWKLDGSKA